MILFSFLKFVGSSDFLGLNFHSTFEVKNMENNKEGFEFETDTEISFNASWPRYLFLLIFQKIIISIFVWNYLLMYTLDISRYIENIKIF
jgi:hypothetical protein